MICKYCVTRRELHLSHTMLIRITTGTSTEYVTLCPICSVGFYKHIFYMTGIEYGRE